MFLKDVEQASPEGEYSEKIQKLKSDGHPIPQILHLFAFKPQNTDFLAQFTQQVMRGDSPLSPGMRELIAAYTSHTNDCHF